MQKVQLTPIFIEDYKKNILNEKKDERLQEGTKEWFTILKTQNGYFIVKNSVYQSSIWE